jgi:hypothetical protein
MPIGITGQNSDGSYLLKAGVTIGGGIPPIPPDTTVIPPKPPDSVSCDTTIKVTTKTPVYTTRTVIDTSYIIVIKDSVIHRICPVVPPAPVTTSVFTTQIPTGALLRDNTTGIELGMKFTSSIAGSILGVRFYKQSGNSGIHTGELYSSTGTRLASAVYINETASGWQTVIFSQPVPINAQTTYVVACFSPAGWYSSDDTGFKVPIVNSPLTAAMGVYKYTTSAAFPNNTYLTSNYWIDLIYAK